MCLFFFGLLLSLRFRHSDHCLPLHEPAVYPNTSRHPRLDIERGRQSSEKTAPPSLQNYTSQGLRLKPEPSHKHKHGTDFLIFQNIRTIVQLLRWDLSQHQSDPCVKLHEAVIRAHSPETLTGTLPPYQISASASSLSCSFRFACSIGSMFVFSSSALWSPSPEYSTTSHSTFTRPSSDC